MSAQCRSALDNHSLANDEARTASDDQLYRSGTRDKYGASSDYQLALARNTRPAEHAYLWADTRSHPKRNAAAQSIAHTRKSSRDQAAAHHGRPSTVTRDGPGAAKSSG